MVLKAISGATETILLCDNIRVQYGEDLIEIEMTPGGRKIVLPADADTVYVMNDRRQTVATYRHPLAGQDPTRNLSA